MIGITKCNDCGYKVKNLIKNCPKCEACLSNSKLWYEISEALIMVVVITAVFYLIVVNLYF